MPKVEYLPSGNRNLVISMILPPPGYNVDQLAGMGEQVEETLSLIGMSTRRLKTLRISITRRSATIFTSPANAACSSGLRAHDPLQARKLIDLIQDKLKNQFPGSFVTAQPNQPVRSRTFGGQDD